MHRLFDSMLGAMFLGRHHLDMDKDSYYFIDQDGTHFFRHIINYLRNGGLLIGWFVVKLHDYRNSKQNFYSTEKNRFLDTLSQLRHSYVYSI